MKVSSAFALAAIGLASPALAEVKSATPAGFEVSRAVSIAAPPYQVYVSLRQVGQWWSKDHTYSGVAANLLLDARAGGCFCERLRGGGSVEHGRVVYAEPGVALRVIGAFGPLQQEGATGALTWSLKPEGKGTRLTQTYVVGGYIRGGGDRIAPNVEQVLGEQLDRLKTYIEAPQK